MPVKKETIKKSTAVRLPSPAKKAKVRSRKSDSLSVPVYSLAGVATGTLALPKEVFGQKVNKKLLSQAIRVYTVNQKNFTASTKTRGEVEGSTAKIYRQKGTGRARHGAIRAPIFVGGGIVFGPKPRQVRLTLPQKMKKAALLSALSFKAGDKKVVGASGLEKASGKTKEIVKLLDKIVGSNKQKSSLIVIDNKQDNIVRAARNIPGVSVLPVNIVNAYEVLKHDMLILTRDVVDKLGKAPAKEQK